jgi:hypothetical protein
MNVPNGIPRLVLLGGAVLLAVGCTEGSDPSTAPLSAAKPATALAVTALSPDSVPRDTTLDVRVLGSGFDNGTVAAFLLNGQPDPRVHVNSSRFVKSTEIVANVTIGADAVAAKYDAQVTTSGGKKGIGTELLTVLPYTVLETFDGARSSAFDINDEGSVVGRADTLGTSGRAVVWDSRSGSVRSLGTLEAYVIDNNRTVLGLVSGVGPVRWAYDGASDSWTWTELPSPTGDNAFPQDVNQSGVIVGWADSVVGGVTGAIMWPTPTQWVALDQARRWSYSSASAVNEAGWVVGYGRNVAGAGDAWVWVPNAPGGTTGTFAVLPRFAGVVDQHATGLNDLGDVVGWGETSKGADYALLWRRNPSAARSDLSDLYLPPADLGAAVGKTGRASDINNAGIVVGRAHSAAYRYTYDAFVWDQSRGMRMLPRPPGGDSQVARLNESSPASAAGSVMINGTWHAIRWQLF